MIKSVLFIPTWCGFQVSQALAASSFTLWVISRVNEERNGKDMASRYGGGESLLKRCGRAWPGANTFGRPQSGHDPEPHGERGRKYSSQEPKVQKYTKVDG